MKPYFDVVIVIPIGPNSSATFITDTIESYIYYTRASYVFILADDSHQGVGSDVQKVLPEAVVLLSEKPMGGWAGLYINLARSFAYALEHYTFKTLFKLDTDALIIGPEPEKEAIELFEHDEKAGIAGQYPNDYHGEPWDLGWPKDRVYNSTQSWKFIRRPRTNFVLTPLARRARANGYRNGESVFGGAYFMGYQYLSAMQKAGQLPNMKLKRLNMGEDHIFGLLTKAVGFELCSLSGPGQPFGLEWKGLPVPPEQLVKDGKKITHSVRSWQQMNEADIRQWFKEKRVL